jgi:hypothetical protein
MAHEMYMQENDHSASMSLLKYGILKFQIFVEFQTPCFCNLLVYNQWKWAPLEIIVGELWYQTAIAYLG